MQSDAISRRSYLQASTAAGLGATLSAGCLGGSGDPSDLGLAFTVPVENIGSLLAVPEIREQMEHVGEDYQLDVTRNSTTPDSLNQMAAGEVDMALVTTVAFGNAVEQEAVPGNISAVTTDFWDAHEDHYGFTVYSAADSEITEPADLEGATLGINALDTGIHTIYAKQLTDVGLDPEEDVEFTEMGFQNFTAAINEGRIDAGIYPALFAGQARSEGFTPVFRSQDVYDSAYPFAFMTARQNSIEEKREALTSWGEDFRALLDYMRENRSTVVSQAAEHFDLDEPVVDSFFLTERDYYRGEPTTDVDRLQAVMDEAADFGFTEGTFTADDHVTNEFVAE